MPIPVFNPTIGRKDMDSVLTCMVSDLIGPGELNDNLIDKLSLHFPHSGGICLRDSLRALEVALSVLLENKTISEGSSVLISALAPSYYYQVITKLNLNALVCDVDPLTAVMSQEELTKKAQYASLIIVDYPIGNYPPIELLRSFSIPIIEDVSCAVGSANVISSSNDENETTASETTLETNTTKFIPGTLGSYVILSMEANHLITSGGGAVLLASSRGDYQKLHKYSTTLDNSLFLPDINAALAVVQTSSLASRLTKRENYFNLFASQVKKSHHKMMKTTGELNNFFYSFPLVIEVGMSDVVAYAKKKGVETALAFENCVLDLIDPDGNQFPSALSVKLKTILFPLYSLLGSANATLIGKVLLTLP